MTFTAILTARHRFNLALTPISARLQHLGRGMRACLPRALRRWLARRQAPDLVLTRQGHGAALWRELNGKRTLIAQLEAEPGDMLSRPFDSPRQGWRDVVIELPAEQILERSVTLPSQVKNNLRQVISYELDRLTPFQAGTVYFDVGPLHERPQATRIEARLALCRRDQVEHWLERLRRMGVPPARLAWHGAWDNANLLPIEQRPRRNHLGHLLTVALLLLALALLFAAMFSPLWQKNRELEQLERTLRALRIEAEQVPALREELERARAGSLAVLERKARQPLMIDLLRELTDLLPDHTWVQTINVTGSEVDIRGESGQASELLSLLEQAPGISHVSFRSPIMQIPNTGNERFHIAFSYRLPQA